MADYEPKNLDPLLALFNVGSKAEAERHCKTLLIYGTDLAALVTSARVGVLDPYKYACHFDETSPPHLKPKASELEAARKMELGPLGGEAKKLFRKLTQTFEERRVFAAHLFYTEDYRFWHLLYFDQHDVSDRNNHWKRGPHVHYANDTFHHMPLNQIWDRVCLGETAFLKPVHIPFHGWDADA